jgi:K(+)-stimulated pyrophosphate-energized sodium pump
VVKYSGNTGLRVGVAVGAVVIIIAAVVISKRRAHSMGEDVPAGAEVSGATSPAASVGSPDETAAAVSAPASAADATAVVPAAAVADEASHQNGNGHVATGSPSSADLPPGE